MLKNEAIAKEKAIMDSLYSLYSKMDYQPERTGAEQNGVGDMITFDFEAGINNEPGLMQSYFLPIHEEEVRDNFFVFSVALTDEIPGDEKKLDMLQLINILNFNIAYGQFVFDTDIDILTYKYAIPAADSMSEQEAIDYLTRHSMIGFGIVNLYIDLINAYLEDRIDWEEFLIALADIVGEPAEA